MAKKVEIAGKTRPYTTAELFRILLGRIKENGDLPDILDYTSPARDKVPIPTYEFDITSDLRYGGCEGIYLNLGIRFADDKTREYVEYHIGTIKTLSHGKEAMRTMGTLLADFIVENNQFVNGDIDAFSWRGFEVTAYDIEGEWKNGVEVYSEERALERAKNFAEKYAQVKIRNNATREVKEFKAEKVMAA